MSARRWFLALSLTLAIAAVSSTGALAAYAYDGTGSTDGLQRWRAFVDRLSADYRQRDLAPND